MFEKFLERWGTEELIKVEGNFSPLIIGSGVSDIFQKELLTYASFDFGGLVILFRRQYGMFFFSMDRYRGSSDAALTEYLAHEGAFRYEEDFKKLWKQAEAWYTAYPPAELEKLPSEELVSLFREISTAFQMFYVYSIFVEAIDKDYIEETQRRVNDDTHVALENWRRTHGLGFAERVVQFENMVMPIALRESRKSKHVLFAKSQWNPGKNP